MAAQNVTRTTPAGLEAHDLCGEAIGFDCLAFVPNGGYNRPRPPDDVYLRPHHRLRSLRCLSAEETSACTWLRWQPSQCAMSSDASIRPVGDA